MPDSTDTSEQPVTFDAESSKEARLGVAVPLITDDGLGDEFEARVDHGRTSSVILGNDGRVLEVLRHLPADDCAPAILLAVERLTEEFPDRFSVLPEFDENTTELADPNGDMSAFTGPSFRQRLSWLTGDQDQEKA